MHATRFSAGSLLVLISGALAGCSYHSTYIPPNDGRARLVWDGKGVVEYLPEADSTCVATLEKLRNGEGQSAMELTPHARWWHPEDEEIAEVPEPSGTQEWSEVDPGGGDSSASATRGQSRHRGHHARGHGGSRGGGRGAARVSSGSRGGRTFATPRIGRSGHSSGSKSSSGGRSGGGGGGGKGAGAAAVALIVVLYAIMPVAAIVWSESTPEGSGVGSSIDAVHAYNDLARSGAADCGGDR